MHGRSPDGDGAHVTIDDRVVGTTREPWTMGHPAASLRWLGGCPAEQGLRLRRGQVILTGSALPLFPVGPSGRVVAEARPLGMGGVAFDRSFLTASHRTRFPSAVGMPPGYRSPAVK